MLTPFDHLTVISVTFIGHPFVSYIVESSKLMSKLRDKTDGRMACPVNVADERKCGFEALKLLSYYLIIAAV